MGRSKLAHRSQPPPEKLRVDHAKARRELARAERHHAALAVPRDDESKRKSRARKRALTLARKVAAGLPTPLACSVRTSGLGEIDNAGVTGWERGRREVDWGQLVRIFLFSLPAIIGWCATATGAEVEVLDAIFLFLATLMGLAPPVQTFWRVWKKARTPVPVKLQVRWGASEKKGVGIEWEDGLALELPIEEIARTEMWLGEDRSSPGGAEGGGAGTSTVEIVRRDGARVKVSTTSLAAQQLEAAIHVARADRNEERASSKRRAASKARAVEIAAPAASVDPALPAPNEAALSALDRDGRSMEAWREALRAAFANVGYRHAPPLPPGELLQVVTDLRISAERRIGAAIALSSGGDEELRARLRIAAGEMETPALRIAVERAADGSLEDEGLEEALSDVDGGADSHAR